MLLILLRCLDLENHIGKKTNQLYGKMFYIYYLGYLYIIILQ